MANVTVEAQYIADTTRYVRSLQAATAETARFAREIPQAVQATEQLKASSIGLSAALGTVGAIIGAKAIGAIQKYAMQGIAAAKQYEQTVISIEGIFAGTGMSMEAAAEKTKGYLADLRDFAAETPFELPQVLDAVKRLLSIGYAADDVKDRLLPAVGDIVAALGQPPHAVSAVVYAFGQMKSAGRVLSQDLMQIGNALPGFNAKMALASKMFQGDMFALTKAMESGALDSTKAIDVIIEAMQEFGGAAGAMERQSQTLVGVMSTFADTINNALIDGLMPSLPVLSATLNQVMPEVEALATSFAQALGPALISGADSIGRLAPVFTEVLPPIIEMASQLTSLSDVVVAFAPALEFAAGVVGFMADALSALPSPVYAAVATMLVLRTAMKKMGLDAAAASGQATGAFTRMALAVRGSMGSAAAAVSLGGYAFRKMMTDAAAAAAGVTSAAVRIKAAMLGIRTTASLMGTSFVATMRTMGVAVKGFMASLGPVGWAIMAASAAFEILGGQSAAAEGLIEELKATIDETTGAFGELTAATVAAKLRADLGFEGEAELARMGITVQAMTRALIEGGPALEGMRARLDDATYSADGLVGTLTATGPHMMTVQRNFDGMADALAATKTAMDQEAKSAEEAARITSLAAQERAMTSRYASAAEIKALQEKRDAFLSMSKEEQAEALRSAATAGIVAARKAEADATLAAAQDALRQAFAKTQTAFEKFMGVLSTEASMDAARRSVMDLEASLKENGRTMSEHTKKGLENRAAVREVAQSYIDWAKDAKDPQEQQRRLMEGERELRRVLGKRYDKLEVTRAFEEARDTTAEYAKEWGKAADDAKKAGNDVGYQFVKGIIEGLEKNKGALEAAGAGAAGSVEDGAAGAQGFDTGSPSKKGITLGREFVDGLMIGLDQMGLLKGKGASLGTGLAMAVKQAIQTGGSVTDLLSGMLGGLPSLPTPLEMALGGPDKVEKWKKKHEKQLVELARMAGELDKAVDAMRSSQDAMRSLGAATAKPTGVYKGVQLFGESDLTKSLGSKSDLDSAMKMLNDMAAAAEQGYQAMLAVAKKGDKARIQAQRAATSQQIDTYRQEVAGYMIRRQQIEQELSKLEANYQGEVNRINAHYDELDKAAAAALRATEAKWDGVIRGLESALQAATAAFDKENGVLQQLIQDRDQFLSKVADGFSNYAREIDREGGSFADSFEKRLADVQAFSQNIQTLIARGLDPAIVKEFVEAGVAGAGAAAGSLATASDEEIARINSAQTALAAEIATFGSFASMQWYNAGIAQQEAILAPLQAAKTLAEQTLATNNTLRAQEIAAAQAYQEQLRVDRANALAAAQATYEAERTRLEAEAKEINEALDQRADDILVYFLALKQTMEKQMLDLGKKIVNKIIAGLVEREGALYAKANDIASRVRSIIASAFDINSPSGVMQNYGEMIAAGLALGIQNGTADVAAAAQAMANAGVGVDVGSLSPSFAAAALSGSSFAGPAATSDVTVESGAVQITFPQGSMDNLSAEEIQRIVEESLLNLAREIRRT